MDIRGFLEGFNFNLKRFDEDSGQEDNSNNDSQDDVGQDDNNDNDDNDQNDKSDKLDKLQKRLNKLENENNKLKKKEKEREKEKLSEEEKLEVEKQELEEQKKALEVEKKETYLSKQVAETVGQLDHNSKLNDLANFIKVSAETDKDEIDNQINKLKNLEQSIRDQVIKELEEGGSILDTRGGSDDKEGSFAKNLAKKSKKNIEKAKKAQEHYFG